MNYVFIHNKNQVRKTKTGEKVETAYPNNNKFR
jgi:hypothetical protein